MNNRIVSTEVLEGYNYDSEEFNNSDFYVIKWELEENYNGQSLCSVEVKQSSTGKRYEFHVRILSDDMLIDDEMYELRKRR